jgi:hypothetical protein
MAREDVQLQPWLQWIWRAWERLHQDRPMLGGGMTAAVPGRIPWRDIRAWCGEHNYGPGEMEFMDACFGQMDAEYSAWHAEQMKKD